MGIFFHFIKKFFAFLQNIESTDRIGENNDVLLTTELTENKSQKIKLFKSCLK